MGRGLGLVLVQPYPLTRQGPQSKWSVREHRFQFNACASSKDSFWLQYTQNTVLQEGRLLEALY